MPNFNYSILPVTGLQKVGDILAFDGPILSLFIDDKRSHFLFYWVDFGDSYNRWLVWKVKDDHLYYYLQSKLSLLDLLITDPDDYIFIIDIDGELNFGNLKVVTKASIPIEYLPDSVSFFRLFLPQFGVDFIHEFEKSDNYYRILMRDKSIIFSIELFGERFAKAVSTSEASGFLAKLTKSINGFVEESFWNTFKGAIKTSAEYLKALAQMKEILSPRIYALAFGSFEVSVGVDTVSVIQIQNFGAWQKSVLPEYEKEVVNVDYTDDTKLKLIAEKYSEEARVRIFEPYIKIINSSTYQLSIKDKSKKTIRKYAKIEKKKEDIIVPAKKIEDIKQSSKRFVSLIVEIDEDQEIAEIDKRSLKSGLLFSEQLREVELGLLQAENEVVRITFKTVLPYTFSINENVYNAFVSDPFDIMLNNSDKEKLLLELSSTIAEMYLTTRDFPDTDPVRKYFKTNISEVKTK